MDTMDTMDIMDKMDKAAGFTLIELLVTVAVIGILAAMAVAQFDVYKRKANDVSTQSQVKGLILSAETLNADTLITLNGSEQMSVSYAIGGTPTVTSNVAGITTEAQLAPGFSHDPKVEISIVYSGTNPHPSFLYYIYGAHCYGSAAYDQVNGYAVQEFRFNSAFGSSQSRKIEKNPIFGKYVNTDGSDCP